MTAPDVRRKALLNLRQADRITGYANPDNSGRGNWSRRSDGPSLVEFVIAVAVMLVFGAAVLVVTTVVMA